MKDLLNIKYWLFDLDNTLYSGDTKVFDQVDKRMSKYISDKLNVSINEAKKIMLVSSHKQTIKERLQYFGEKLIRESILLLVKILFKGNK